MKNLVLILLTILGLTLGREREAHAEPRAAYALIVTNNRSTRLSRPDLRYADDDGAKYYALFRTMARESNVTLLTTFDGDTQKLFPELVGKERPPTRANVFAAARAFADKIRGAKAAAADFYFVFAGHGDIEGGKGFLELADGAFTSDDLEALLRSMPATRSHVILDSCNSFFVINSRKPGGRHFVTSTEATERLSERLPNVGVFLSTSAEAEVFEWSELQSGVFSHAVRSGLSGAADANADGSVSYDELRAFVNVATKPVKNPNFRPQVFARGPSGRGTDALLVLDHPQATRLDLDEAQRRVTVHDENDLPLVDVHKEAGRSLTLWIPNGAEVEELDSSGVPLRRYALSANHDPRLASLAPISVRARARGADDMFKTLFAQPFGAKAFDADRAEEAKAGPLVLGVSADERERLRLLLRESADSARRTRLLGGVTNLVVGATAGVGGSLLLASGLRRDATGTAVVGGVTLGLGAVVGALGVLRLAVRSQEEKTLDEFSASLAQETDIVRAQGAYAAAEWSLLSCAERDYKRRTSSSNRVLTVLGAGVSTGLVAVRFVKADGRFSKLEDPAATAILAGSAIFYTAMFIDTFFPTATERMAELWRSDPSRLRSSASRPRGVTLSPIIVGAGAGVGGTF